MSEEPKGEIAPGRVVGGFAIQGHLGGTTWAETYVAAAESGDLVALKVVDASISRATGVAEGIEHARASIVSLSEHLVLRPIAAAEEEGARFIATPLSDHPSLADLVDICPLSPTEAITLVKNLAIAVEAAHTAGVAHLALKPSNIFVGPPPTHAVRITDFGADALRRAKEGAHPWLAPEQRSEDEAGPSADVFALALVAFFTIAGKQYETDGKKPSEQSADVPPALDAPLLRALSEKPENRFGSARDFADALERSLEAPLKQESIKITVKETDAPGSDRHIKATQKLERFRLPSMIAPVVDRTVKIEKFEAPPEALPSAAPAATNKTPLIPDVPSVNRTAKLAPAQVPEQAPAAQHVHKRFYVPEQKAAATATVRPPEPPAALVSEQATSKMPKAAVVPGGIITRSMRRVQHAWNSGDQRKRQLVIAWGVFAFIVVVALVLGASSVVRALLR